MYFVYILQSEDRVNIM